MCNKKGECNMTKIQKLKRKMKIWKYALILGAILLTIYSFAMIFLEYVTGKRSVIEIAILTIVFILVLVLMYLAFLFVYEEIIKKQSKSEIQNEELKKKIPTEYLFIEDSFTEVYLRDEDSEGIYEERLRKKLDAKYYARLISYDEIEVILKDKEGDYLKKPERISDFVYFKEHYKPRKDCIV